MMLFGKKKAQKKETVCACQSADPGERCGKTTAACCPEAEREICCVKVLGMGCRSCREQYENAKEAVRRMGMSVEVAYITEPEKVMAYGVMSMPALVVNERVVSTGKVLRPDETEKLLRAFFS
ncbi:MAG: thioredoxin family protein [Oscillospiraceae bacterium]